MNDRELLELAAKAAGIDYGIYSFTAESLVGFAALVAAAEREECAKVCEEHWRNNGNAMECADAIRARGEK